VEELMLSYGCGGASNGNDERVRVGARGMEG